MGLLLLYPHDKRNNPSLIYSLDYTEGRKAKSQALLYQSLIIKLKHHYKQFAFLYIRETPTEVETTEISKKFKNFDGIIGDLNLNPSIVDQKTKLERICGKTKCLAL